MTPHAARLPSYVLCLVLTLAGCRGNARTDDASPSPQQAPQAGASSQQARPSIRPRVVALGDSLTAGLGLPPTEAYPALLQKKVDAAGLGYEVVNAGVSGDTSAGGLRRLDWALDGDVRVLIVALGANDGLRGLPVSRMRENLEAILERAKSRKVRVILAGMEAPPNFGPEYTTGFRNAYRELARAHEVTFIPFLLDKVAGESHLNQGDGIHPNAEGAGVVAETVWQALQPILRRLSATT